MKKIYDITLQGNFATGVSSGLTATYCLLAKNGLANVFAIATLGCVLGTAYRVARHCDKQDTINIALISNTMVGGFVAAAVGMALYGPGILAAALAICGAILSVRGAQAAMKSETNAPKP